MSTYDPTHRDTPTTQHPRGGRRSRDEEEEMEIVEVELRAADPAGTELQIWRIHEKPRYPIQSGMLVSLWDSKTNSPLQILRRVTGVRSIEEHWVEFILEGCNAHPSSPSAGPEPAMYLAVPVKWANLHRKTKLIRKLTRTANHLYNTYLVAPEALKHIRQTEINYWATRT